MKRTTLTLLGVAAALICAGLTLPEAAARHARSTEADGGVCTLRGTDARRILAGEFGVEMTLSGVYDLMHRLNLSCLRPRPLHRKNDPQAVADWLQHAPFLRRK